MKVMLLTETLSVGGAETFVVRLANALAGQMDVILVTMHGEMVHPAVRHKLSGHVACEEIRLPLKAMLWKAASLVRKLGIDWSPVDQLIAAKVRKLVERERPQVIHSHLFHADVCASKAARSASRPPVHVMTVHGDYEAYASGEADPQTRSFAPKFARTVEHAGAIVCVAKDQFAFFAERFPGARPKLHLIHNGYDPEVTGTGEDSAAIPLPVGKFLFGMLSRGVEKKGWEQAIEAFGKLGRSDAALILVGEGPALNRLRLQHQSEGIVFAGFSAHPLDLVRKFDACLLPTAFAHESLPTAIIEYLACGKPVIATEVGEVRTMLTSPDGRLGGLLLDLDGEAVSADQLASNMRLLLDDPDLRARLASDAAASFDKFRMDRCTSAYEALYRSLLP